MLLLETDEMLMCMVDALKRRNVDPEDGDDFDDVQEQAKWEKEYLSG